MIISVFVVGPVLAFFYSRMILSSFSTIGKGMKNSGFSVIGLGIANYICKGKDKKNMMAWASWGMNFHVGF